ncbi:MAG: ATPase, T2SS/T4P/T4SS family [Candidatus Riflebacteria bacterium]|nr:ATPase, T2SS/T4P/T4SS family [Candidatus Riflebacteria bacterium]
MGSKIDDGFGIIPVCFAPGPIRRLFGHSTFVYEAENINIGSSDSPQRLSWAEIDNITASDGQIHLTCASGRVLSLSCGQKAVRAALLANRLRNEYLELQDFFATEKNITIERGFALFEKCLEFRALPYVRAVDVLLKTAVANFFTDIHLEPIDAGVVRISYRVGGEVKSAVNLSRNQHDRVTARLKHLAGCLSHVFDTAQEGAFRQENFDVRISTFPTGNGERVSLRIITALRFKKVADLGWSEQMVAGWLGSIKGVRGLFIISGPVGSGKTTAMYATLSELASEGLGLRVVTVEDPVEAAIGGICQSSLDQMKEKDLAAAFKHLLRQDPNIVALGEIRDLKCIKEALQAGLSGHLVLATFHAGSINEALDRIRQMGGEDRLVLSGLKGILHLDLKRKQGKIVPEVDFALFDGSELRKKV